MGCGCSKGGQRNTNRVNNPQQPVQRDNVVQQPSTPAPTVQSVQPKVARNTNSLDRRNIEKIRREAIKRALGR